MNRQTPLPQPKRKQPNSIRIPADLRAYLRTEAKKNTRSYSGEVVHRLEASRKAEQQSAMPMEKL